MAKGDYEQNKRNFYYHISASIGNSNHKPPYGPFGSKLNQGNFNNKAIFNPAILNNPFGSFRLIYPEFGRDNPY